MLEALDRDLHGGKVIYHHQKLVLEEGAARITPHEGTACNDLAEPSQISSASVWDQSVTGGASAACSAASILRKE